MEVKRIKVDIVSIEQDINNKFVELTARDATNHIIKLELDEINVANWILNEAYAEAGLDNDPAVEGYSPDEIHHESMQALFDYLTGKRVAWLELRGIGIQLCDWDNI